MDEAGLNITLDQRSAVPLYEQICQQIRQKIESRQLQPGAPLPTNHEFCAQLQVSYTTAQQAMATLAKEGYVTRQARRGTVVKGIPRRGVVGIYSWVELLGQHTKYEYYRLITEHLSRQLEAHGRVYRMYLGSESLQTPNTAAEDLLRHLSGGTLCAALLVNPPPQLEELIRLGRSSHVPVIALISGCNTDYSVLLDYPGAIGSMARHLVDQGRRRVGIVYSRLSRSLREPESIARILEESGCAPQPAWIVGRDDNEQGGYEAAAALPLDELDGLIVADDVMALGVDKRLSELKVNVPVDLTVATFWNRGSRLELALPFERFEMDVQKLARLSLQLVQDAIEGQRINEPHMKIVPVLEAGPTASSQVKRISLSTDRRTGLTHLLPNKGAKKKPMTLSIE